jgi:hypothetical protein
LEVRAAFHCSSGGTALQSSHLALQRYQTPRSSVRAKNNNLDLEMKLRMMQL